jgi:CheY-like chemotaxis protein
MKFNNAYVVDDDKVHHFIIKKLLEKNHIQTDVSFFENGHLALDDLKAKLQSGIGFPDIILLDINMPVLDGWQFLAEFNQIKDSIQHSIAIYIVTSSEHSFNLEKVENVSRFNKGILCQTND